MRIIVAKGAISRNSYFT